MKDFEMIGTTEDHENPYPCPFCKGHNQLYVKQRIAWGTFPDKYMLECCSCHATSQVEPFDWQDCLTAWVKVAKRCNNYKQAKWLTK
jgi:hypothetical protein